MHITATNTTSQVLIRARTTLTVEDFEFRLGNRRARIKTASAYWLHDGQWKLEFVNIEGPVLLTTGGRGESRVLLSRDTLPSEPDKLPFPVVPPVSPTGRALSLIPTPHEFVDALREAKPEWEPVIPASPYDAAVLRGVKH